MQILLLKNNPNADWFDCNKPILIGQQRRNKLTLWWYKFKYCFTHKLKGKIYLDCQKTATKILFQLLVKLMYKRENVFFFKYICLFVRVKFSNY